MTINLITWILIRWKQKNIKNDQSEDKKVIHFNFLLLVQIKRTQLILIHFINQKVTGVGKVEALIRTSLRVQKARKGRNTSLQSASPDTDPVSSLPSEIWLDPAPRINIDSMFKSFKG